MGTLTDSEGPATFLVLYGVGRFAAVGSQLVTAWSGSLTPGTYTTAVLALLTRLTVGFDLGIFTIDVRSSSEAVKIVGDPSSIYDQPLPKGV